MNHDIDASALTESAASVLEDAAFLFTEPAEEQLDQAGDLVRARIRFSGPASGFLQINTPVEGCTTLAANMLGIDADDDDAFARGKDALGEILNILCGAVLGRAFGGHDITMGLPALVANDDPSHAPQGSDVRAGLMTDEGFGMEFVLRFDGTGAP